MNVVIIAAIIGIFLIGLIVKAILTSIANNKYHALETEVLGKLGFSNWNFVSYFDSYVTVKSRQALEKYDEIKFFKENEGELARAEKIIDFQSQVIINLGTFLEHNEYESNSQYYRLVRQIDQVMENASAYRIKVLYITPAGNNKENRVISLKKQDLAKFRKDPSLLMGKGEYNKYLKDQQKEALNQKQHTYYDRVNSIIDYANQYKSSLIIKESQDKLDTLIAQLFDRTVNSIKKIKSTDSEEWVLINDFIEHIDANVREIVAQNIRILDYYQSPAFTQIKSTCETLMSTQREFNDYITEKMQSITKLFGTRVVRNETIHDDEFNYIRPYQKTITPFTAEVSATVFASAENSPLDYVIKYFYPNKQAYPEQIKKLQLLLEELETLKDAKQIIENYKSEYRQYLGNVPDFVIESDESGFYSRLGFANIDESILAVEYKFSYTSGGGMAQRSFTVPMTEETIVELIQALEGKLTSSTFAKDQRNLMTRKLRDYIKARDHFTCCICGNSTSVEPNLLLEIDHIIPVAKGGCTVENNLQTLCWKCNRAKSDKIMD